MILEQMEEKYIENATFTIEQINNNLKEKISKLGPIIKTGNPNICMYPVYVQHQSNNIINSFKKSHPDENQYNNYMMCEYANSHTTIDTHLVY